MHLEFTDEQLELRESARATLAKECPPRLVRDVAVGDEGVPAFDTQLTWLGWPALTIDPDLGGLGRGFVELAVVLEELGRVAAPGPFLATMTQFVPAVREAGTTAQVHRFLAAVAAGHLNGTLALHEGGRWDPFSIGATATRDGDGWVLSGHKHQVLCCADVDEVVVAARRESGALGLFVVPAAELTFARVTSLDGTRSLGNLELKGVWVPEARMLGDASASTDATPALSAMLAEATVGMALDMLGVCEALFQSSLDVALDGVGGRREPGSDATPPGGTEAITAPVDTAPDRNGARADPLSSASGTPARSPSQATKHRLIDMLMALERARATIYHAVGAVAGGHERAAIAASAAKAAAGACQRVITGNSIEVHGAGPRRSEASLWVRRAQAGELLLGSSADHRRVVADDLLRVPKRQGSSGSGLAAVLGL
ncbi:MAG: acyl-CoA dehydrogenase family protein [Acidimicrobiales bacterium]